MAAVGLRYFVAAKIENETRGQPIQYGTGMRLGPARAANLTLERNSDPLHGDDVEQDNDNTILGGTIETESTQMTAEERCFLLGETKVTGTENEYEDSGEPSPAVGFGFFRVLRQKDMSTQKVSTVYEAWWYHKAQFTENSMNGATKEGRITWQTPRITGRLLGVYIDGTGNPKFRRHAEFDNEADAIAWLSEKANITQASADPEPSAGSNP